jgi:hypothetical protein
MTLSDEPIPNSVPPEPQDDLVRWIDDRGWVAWLDVVADQAGTDTKPRPEMLEEGGSLWLDVTSVVDHMRRGVRPGFTVWIALEEALRWWVDEHQAAVDGAPDADDLDLEDPDPLRTALVRLIDILDETDQLNAAEALQQAVRRWVTTMSDHYNKGYPWPQPLPRRHFPPSPRGA